MDYYNCKGRIVDMKHLGYDNHVAIMIVLLKCTNNELTAFEVQQTQNAEDRILEVPLDIAAQYVDVGDALKVDEHEIGTVELF